MNDGFHTPDGRAVTAVTADEMRAVDRVASEIGLQLLQMMENAGRTLACHVRDARADEPVVVVAGNGGNGGGGLACARHLVNRDTPVQVVLDRSDDELTGAAAQQHGILSEMAVETTTDPDRIVDGAILVDALVGYGLSGDVRDPARTYIERINGHRGTTVSLDVPSGVDATTGDTLGVAVTPDRTVTLALPKTGLAAIDGHIVLADIGIPATVYDRLEIAYEPPFETAEWVDLVR